MKRQQEKYISEYRMHLKLALDGRDQDAVARQCGLSQPTISRWLNGKTEPKLADATAVAHALGRTIAEMVGETESDFRQENWQKRAMSAEQKLEQLRRGLTTVVRDVFGENF